MPMPRYKIVGHRLCPYVQRVVITMLELKIPFDRIDIDLAAKPGWLAGISPGGLVPAVQVGPDDWLTESDVIARYLDSVFDGGLLPEDPLARAHHEAWMKYAEGMLNIVARLIYLDKDAAAVGRSISELVGCLRIVDERFAPAPYLGGHQFGLVDIVYATLFRSLPVLGNVADRQIGAELPGALVNWWERVRVRPSIIGAVPQGYETELGLFIAGQKSHAGRIMSSAGFLPACRPAEAKPATSRQFHDRSAGVRPEMVEHPKADRS
jgi:glutathione S-transferase